MYCVIICLFLPMFFQNMRQISSKINIGKYKKFLTHEELNIIEHHLSEYIYGK